MWIKFLLDAQLQNPETHRYRKLRAGKAYDLPDEQAQRFIERGAAVAVEEEEAEADPDTDLEAEADDTEE